MSLFGRLLYPFKPLFRCIGDSRWAESRHIYVTSQKLQNSKAQ